MALSQSELRSGSSRISVINQNVPVEQNSISEELTPEQIIQQTRQQLEQTESSLSAGIPQVVLRSVTRGSIPQREQLSLFKKEVKEQADKFEKEVALKFPEFAKKDYREEAINLTKQQIESKISQLEKSYSSADKNWDYYKSKGNERLLDYYDKKMDEISAELSVYKNTLSKLTNGDTDRAIKEFQSGYSKDLARYEAKSITAEQEAKKQFNVDVEKQILGIDSKARIIYDSKGLVAGAYLPSYNYSYTLQQLSNLDYISGLQKEITAIDPDAKIFYDNKGVPVGAESPKYQQTLNIEGIKSKLETITKPSDVQLFKPKPIEYTPPILAKFGSKEISPIIKNIHKFQEDKIKSIDPDAFIYYNVQTGFPVGFDSPKLQQTVRLDSMTSIIAPAKIPLSLEERKAIAEYQSRTGVRLDTSQLTRYNINRIVAYINQDKTLPISSPLASGISLARGKPKMVDSALAYDIVKNPLGLATTLGATPSSMVVTEWIVKPRMSEDKREELIRQQIESLDSVGNIFKTTAKAGAVFSGSSLVGGTLGAVGGVGKTLITSPPTFFLTEEQKKGVRKELLKQTGISAGTGFVHGALLGADITKGGVLETYSQIPKATTKLELARAVRQATMTTLFDIDKFTGVVGSIDDYKMFRDVIKDIDKKYYSSKSGIDKTKYTVGGTVAKIMLPESELESIGDLIFQGLGAYKSDKLIRHNIARGLQGGFGSVFTYQKFKTAELPSDYLVAGVGALATLTSGMDIKLPSPKEDTSFKVTSTIEGKGIDTDKLLLNINENRVRLIEGAETKTTIDTKTAPDKTVKVELFEKIIGEGKIGKQEGVGTIISKQEHPSTIAGKIKELFKVDNEKVIGFLKEKGLKVGDEGVIKLETYRLSKPVKIGKDIKSNAELVKSVDYFRVTSEGQTKIQTESGDIFVTSVKQRSTYSPTKQETVKFSELDTKTDSDIDLLGKLVDDSFITKKDRFVLLKKKKPKEMSIANIRIDNKPFASEVRVKSLTESKIFSDIGKIFRSKRKPKLVSDSISSKIKEGFDIGTKIDSTSKPISVQTKESFIPTKQDSDYAFGGKRYSETLADIKQDNLILFGVTPKLVEGKVETLIPKVSASEFQPKVTLKQDIKSDIKQLFKPSVKLDTKSDFKLDIKQDVKQDIKQDIKSDIKQLFKTDVTPKMRTSTIQSIKLDTKQVVKPKPRIDTKLDVKLKESSDKKQTLRDRSEGKSPLSFKKEREYYIPEAKRNNKWVKLSKEGLSRDSALGRGARAVDNTVAVSFRIKKAKEGNDRIIDNYYKQNKHKFRDYKIRKGVKIPLKDEFIELKGRHRIDTKGEKEGLTLSKYIKQQGWLSPASKKLARIESKFKIPSGI